MSRLAIIVAMGLGLAACGSGSGSGSGSSKVILPPPNSYDLQKAMVALEAGGLSAPVSLSGTVVSGSTSSSFTGTGTLTIDAGTDGMFNGGAALLQTTKVSGTINVAGTSSSYSSSVVNAYDAATGAILGKSQSGEFDVASAPVMIPSAVGTTPIILGTLSRYADSTLSVVLGTTQISVAVILIPIDPGSREVVRFTIKSYDESGTLVETDTQSYFLTADDVLSFDGATASNASGSISVAPQ